MAFAPVLVEVLQPANMAKVVLGGASTTDRRYLAEELGVTSSRLLGYLLLAAASKFRWPVRSAI
jgi:hypothetical protein